MTNSFELEQDIKNSGLKRKFIAEKLGITDYSLAKKINNVTEFKASEIKMISELLGYSLERMSFIFYAA